LILQTALAVPLKARRELRAALHGLWPESLSHLPCRALLARNVPLSAPRP